MEKIVTEEVKMVVSVPAELLKEIKKRAIDRNATLKEWVTQAILEKLMFEDRAN